VLFKYVRVVAIHAVLTYVLVAGAGATT